MSGKLQSLDLLCCLFLTVASQTGQVSPPRNVSLRWISDFEQELQWEHSVNCFYEVTSNISAELSTLIKNQIQKPPFRDYIVMEGGSVQWSIKTSCNGQSGQSDQVFYNVIYPELVRNLKCYIHSPRQVNCSWEPASQAPDLRFFYCVRDLHHKSPPYHLQECSPYHYTGGFRTGCELQGTISEAVYILFNGTVNHKLARNTFKILLKDNVRPPALKWNVTKSRDEFHISWIPPDIVRQSLWTFVINYTACGDTKLIKIDGKNSTSLAVASHCQYRMSIKAERGDTMETPWSDDKHFDADANPWVYAAIIIPLMFACLAALALMFCRKNKEHLFPKVPEPRDFLSDISDNNNKSNICNLYVPAEEEHNCKITLVIDPQINKLSS